MFQTATILQFSFSVAPVIYMIVGEVIRVTDDKFAPDGFVALGNEIWVIRAILALVSVCAIVASHLLFTNDRLVDSGLTRTAEVTDATILMRLQTAQVLRLAWTESIAVFGITLYVMNADRLDLYGFCLVALANLVTIRPRREQWEAIFRRISAQYPGVSHSPWGSIPS